MGLPKTKAKVIYLEDLKQANDSFNMAKNLLLIKILPTFILSTLITYRQLDETAAIFSSGSEGTPKVDSLRQPYCQ